VEEFEGFGGFGGFLVSGFKTCLLQAGFEMFEGLH
jgi:hypothetical protein